MKSTHGYINYHNNNGMGNGLQCVKRQLSALTLTNNIHIGLSKGSNDLSFVSEVNVVALINYVNHSNLN